MGLLINNCANDLSDFHQAMAVTVLGQAKLVDYTEKADVLPLYLEKHPYLQKFATDASCALMAIHIKGVTMVQQFQNRTELSLESSSG